uniref:Uncharacterized protein n=1 Tax=Rhizophora mucronata TaxID=61149 RepID=A0A2P2J2R5_RHIMU
MPNIVVANNFLSMYFPLLQGITY